MARLWHFVQNSVDAHASAAAKVDHQRSLLLDSLTNSLVNCLEEDGHRVCPQGQMQRLMIGVLQGHIPGINVDGIEIPQPTTAAASASSSSSSSSAAAASAMSVAASRSIDSMTTQALNLFLTTPEAKKIINEGSHDDPNILAETTQIDLKNAASLWLLENHYGLLDPTGATIASIYAHPNLSSSSDQHKAAVAGGTLAHYKLFKSMFYKKLNEFLAFSDLPNPSNAEIWKKFISTLPDNSPKKKH